MKQPFIVIMLMMSACTAHTVFFHDYQRSSKAGTPIRLVHLKQYSALEYRLLLAFASGLAEPILIKHGATLFRLEYWTQTPDSFPTIASGLLAIPRTKEPSKGIVCYQHGTNPDRSQSPSKPTRAEGDLAALIFASGNYILLAPDYVGLGVSKEVHPYLHPESEAQAVVDLLEAARIALAHEPISIPWPNDVYLTGFSQGGQATLAAHRKLQESADPRFRVVADACVAGPYLLVNPDEADTTRYSFENALFGKEWSHTMYLAFLGYAYCKIYREPLRSLFSDEWASTIPAYFNGNRSVDDIMRLFTHEAPNGTHQVIVNGADLFTQAFLDTYKTYRKGQGEPPWLVEKLRENSTVDWIPDAPVRLYYGESDMDVVPIESLTAARLMGANVTAISVGEYGHDESIYQAIPKIRHWFDEMSAGAK